MMVTNDKYELPLVITDSARELARLVGKSESVISSNASRWYSGELKRSRYVFVLDEVEEDD